MTNEQLRLLIRAYADRLETEIDSARSFLPDDAECLTLTERTYVGPKQGLIDLSFMDNDLTHWQVAEVPGEFVALLGLTNFLRDLRQADADLAPVKEESAT